MVIEYKAKIMGTIQVSPELAADMRMQSETNKRIFDYFWAKAVEEIMRIDAAFMADLRDGEGGIT